MSGKKSTPKICGVEGCERPCLARGLCMAHYHRALRARDFEPQPKQLDLTGMRFGWLSVIECERSDGHNRYWKCRCDCGRETVVRAGNLLAGNTKGCGGKGGGCYRKVLPNQKERKRERAKINEHKRRALKLRVGGAFTVADWRALVSRSARCHWCKKPWTKARRPTHDHIIALIEGGANSPENSVAACLDCNLRKGVRKINPATGQGILI